MEGVEFVPLSAHSTSQPQPQAGSPDQSHSTCSHLLILFNDAVNHTRFMSKYEKLVRWGVNAMIKKQTLGEGLPKKRKVCRVAMSRLP